MKPHATLTSGTSESPNTFTTTLAKKWGLKHAPPPRSCGFELGRHQKLPPAALSVTFSYQLTLSYAEMLLKITAARVLLLLRQSKFLKSK